MLRMGKRASAASDVKTISTTKTTSWARPNALAMPTAETKAASLRRLPSRWSHISIAKSISSQPWLWRNRIGFLAKRTPPQAASGPANEK